MGASHYAPGSTPGRAAVVAVGDNQHPTSNTLKGTDMSRYVLRDFDMTDEVVIDPDTTPVSRIKAFFARTLGCPAAHAGRMAWRAVDALTGPSPDLYALEHYGFELTPIP